MNPDRYRTAERHLFADAGIEPTERWLTLPGQVRTRVLDHGEGPPVVFLHGGPNAAATWSYVAAATRGLRCLLVDRPGCGLSDAPATVPDHTTLADYVSRLTIDLLDGLELDRAALVGSSFGGYSALRIAATAPDRITGLVLAGCPAFVPGWTAPAFFSILRTPVVGRVVLALPANRRAVRMSLRQMGHGHALANHLVQAAMLEWMVAWQRHTDTMTNDAEMIVGCGTWRTGFDPALDVTADQLAAVTTPCLVLAGTADTVGGPDVIERLAAALPDATAAYLEGAGHLPWLDDAAWVADHLTEFLSTS